MEYLLDRKKFIDWVVQDNPDLLGVTSVIAQDIIKGSEFIITAQDILDQYVHIPTHILEDEAETNFVNSSECKLIYNQN